ncbi:meiotic recombination protein DMC1 homolog isoform X2 [Syzygium oleosum]|uniref:meiotic recombination protein DMC1 homolog isoform X2 n=1 Tax=Syzygium oleosum TaxID=219896 RepID=UPI0024BB1171|nr:meiotic recombination protein DMC1 homolog isoform X2 [Syzygium oleosum]
MNLRCDQLPTHMRGGNDKVAYIDMDGTFRLDRIVPIAKRFGMDPGAVLDNKKLAQMLSRLLKTAEEFNLAVYMTNQVIADPGRGVFVSDPKKPAGGHVLADAATIRLMFRKGKDNTRGHSQCKGLKRSLQPGRPGEVLFYFESAI